MLPEKPWTGATKALPKRSETASLPAPASHINATSPTSTPPMAKAVSCTAFTPGSGAACAKGRRRLSRGAAAAGRDR